MKNIEKCIETLRAQLDRHHHSGLNWLDLGSGLEI